MADGAYNAAHLRQIIADECATAVVPNTRQRASRYPFNRHLYRECHLAGCCFSRLTQLRRVATRFEKAVKNYLAVVTLAATILWLR